MQLLIKLCFQEITKALRTPYILQFSTRVNSKVSYKKKNKELRDLKENIEELNRKADEE